VVTLSDVLFRRTLLGFTGRMSAESVKEIAGIVGAVLSWSTPEKKKQISSIVLERSLHHES
jgi:glycerol-3-phosphate dehydrogenase